MGQSLTFQCGFSGCDSFQTLSTIVDSWLLPDAELESVTYSHKDVPVSQNWFQLIEEQQPREAMVSFARNQFVSVETKIVITRTRLKVGPRDFVKLLSDVDFRLFSTMTVFRRWGHRKSDKQYKAASFADLHYRHGWACAFKGSGHDRLVSRRWLEHGPWRLIRDEESDLSFVQFHDLEADPETALEQAKPGHKRMGISDEGGFIQTDYVWETEFSGFYLADERQYRIVVAGRDIPQVEMLDACALRHYQKLGEDKPIDSIAYVFPEEDRARKHLHELWLREIECWAIVNGKEVRLDEDYHPEPEKPQWILDVEAREAS